MIGFLYNGQLTRKIEMTPFIACIFGMMVGSIVLLWSAVYKPYDLSHLCGTNEHNSFFCEKSVDMQK